MSYPHGAPLTLFLASGRIAAVIFGIFLGLGVGVSCKHKPPEVKPDVIPAFPLPKQPIPNQIPNFTPVPANTPVPTASPNNPISVREAMNFIQDHEGFSNDVYEDSRGNQTVGFGFNIDAPGARKMALSLGIDVSSRITKGEAKKLFKVKAEEALDGAHRLFDDFDSRPKDVQLAIADMVYNLGVTGFRRLYGTYRAFQNEDYVAAAGRMRRIAWSRQVGERAETLADMVESAALAAR